MAHGFNAQRFDWSCAQPLGVFNKCPPTRRSMNMTCGKILAHAKEHVLAFRQMMGLRICVFHIGVTHNPLMRFQSYLGKAYTHMWVVFCSDQTYLVHMLEAALISEFAAHVGCRNKSGSGGEGALNRANCPDPPYFVYVTGGRADQPRAVG